MLFAKRELKSFDLADDVVQDVFLNLWVKRHNLKDGHSIKGFLFTCLKNGILNAVRTQKNAILKHTKFAEQQVFYSAASDNDIISNEHRLVLNNFISKVSKSKQRIIELRMLGYNNKEISRQVNLSPNTVKMYLSELKRSIRSFVLDPKTKIVALIFLIVL